MDDTKHLQEGLQLVNEAVQMDKEGKLEQASALYKRSLQSLEKALVVEKDPGRKALITQKVGEYRTRSEQIKDQLIKQALLNAPAAPTSFNFPTPPMRKTGAGLCSI
eukprot:TRINITY_DN8641_c0_g1_i3.p1 TRINITY_DN8641_c0_g1~~TRINITY_DN8641_c0_g1_i3.p1  ORF type:complete len:107 (+),score=20.38 TRINITY_DN8641_c0_g1_i3:232-552(+)